MDDEEIDPCFRGFLEGDKACVNRGSNFGDGAFARELEAIACSREVNDCLPAGTFVAVSGDSFECYHRVGLRLEGIGLGDNAFFAQRLSLFLPVPTPPSSTF